MKSNNLFVAGKRAATMALLAASLNNTNAKAYDERAYMSPNEQDTYQSYGVLPEDIDAKQKGNSSLFWLVASVIGALGVAYSIRNFERTRER